MTDDGRAVAVGELASHVRAAGKLLKTAFALVLTTAKGQLASFHKLEGSFAASQAARARPENGDQSG